MALILHDGRSANSTNFPRHNFKTPSEYNTFRRWVIKFAVILAERELFAFIGLVRVCIGCGKSESEVEFVIAHNHPHNCNCTDPRCIKARNSRKNKKTGDKVISGAANLSKDSLQWSIMAFCSMCNGSSRMGSQTAEQFLSPSLYKNFLLLMNVEVTKRHFDAAEHEAWAYIASKRNRKRKDLPNRRTMPLLKPLPK